MNADKKEFSGGRGRPPPCFFPKFQTQSRRGDGDPQNRAHEAESRMAFGNGMSTKPLELLIFALSSPVLIGHYPVDSVPIGGCFQPL